VDRGRQSETELSSATRTIAPLSHRFAGMLENYVLGSDFDSSREFTGFN